jgi:hypothetical protein
MDFDEALAHLKKIVVAEVPADKIDAHAFRLLGESSEAIEREAQQLFEELLRQSPPVPDAMAVAFSFALREVIRERIREIEGGAS